MEYLEGSGRFVPVVTAELTSPIAQRRENDLPIVEYDHLDPLLQRNVAAIGCCVYREKTIPQLTGKLLFGDNPSGENLLRKRR